jgi:hypothetical protein
MKPSNIQDDHHFVKYCKRKVLIRENDVIIGIHPEAFELRPPAPPQFPKPETTLSGVYYEHYDGTDDEKIQACFHFIDMDMKKVDALAKMRVNLIKEQGAKRSRSLRVRHEPFTECLGYSELHGLPKWSDTDRELCSLLARLSVIEIFPVAELL